MLILLIHVHGRLAFQLFLFLKIQEVANNKEHFFSFWGCFRVFLKLGFIHIHHHHHHHHHQQQQQQQQKQQKQQLQEELPSLTLSCTTKQECLKLYALGTETDTLISGIELKTRK